MNQTAFKWIIIAPTIIIFLYAFSSSYLLQNIDNLNYVVAILVDEAEDPNMLDVTFEFIDVSSFSSDSSTKDSTPILDTITASSIDNAINIMNSYAGKGIDLSNCEVAIFSEDVAKKGIFNQISDLINNSQIRPSLNIIVTTGNAKYYVENSTSPLEKILTKYYEIFPNSSKYTGYTSDITIGKFYEYLKNPNIGNTAILGGANEASIKNKEKSQSSEKSSSSNSGSGSSNSGSDQSSGDNSGNQNSNSSEQNEPKSAEENEDEPPASSISSENMSAGDSPIKGQRGNENLGLAVFNGDSYIGKLTAGETLCHSIITNETDSFVISIPDPFGSDNLIALDIYKNSNCNIDIDITSDHPIININISLSGRLSSVIKDLNYADSKTIDTIESATEEYLKKQILDYLNKTSKEYKVDIDGFYYKLKQKFLTIQDLNNYDWENKFQNAEFNLSLDANILSSLLVQNR